MTINRIRTSAMFYFSREGYEGASLSQIAEDVGIRKPSLYAHFKNKEEMFFSCLDHATVNDLAFMQKFIQRHEMDTAVQDVLRSLLVEYETRAELEVVSTFCLRSLYFPPHAFKERMLRLSSDHIARIGDVLLPLFERAQRSGELYSEVTSDEATKAYLCLFDGLMVEYMHAGRSAFHDRLEASWPVFHRGVFVQQSYKMA